MTVQELIDLLEDMDREAEVRIADQPNWPFEYEIDAVAEVDGLTCEECGCPWDEHPELDDDEGCDMTPTDDEAEPSPIVYLATGQQLGYLSGAAATVLGWR